MAQLNDLLVLGNANIKGRIRGGRITSFGTGGPRFVADDGTTQVWFGINESGNAWGMYNVTNSKYVLSDNGTTTTIPNALQLNSTLTVNSTSTLKGAVTIGTSSANAVFTQYGTTSHKVGHIYLEGSNAGSSTGNTTQLVFGTSGTNHIAISSNDKALVLNPTTGSTSNQIVLYLNAQSVFPSGIKATADSLFENALTVKGVATVKSLVITDTSGISHIKFSRTTSHNYLHVPGDSGTIALCANTTLSLANSVLIAAKAMVYPGTSDAYNLGSSTSRWNTVYGHQLYLGGTTNATMTAASTNPRITFVEGTDTQPVHLVYTDYNDYRSPAGLKVIGGADATPAWFEVEGTLYTGAAASIGTTLTTGGAVTIGGALRGNSTARFDGNVATDGNYYIIENALTKGTIPTATTYASIMVLDSTRSTDSEHRCAMVQSYVNTSGLSAIRLYAYQWASGATANSYIYVQEAADGTGKAGSSAPFYGAVWNDYAEFRKYKDSEDIPYGRIVIENGDDSLSLSTERLQKGGNVCSDTFGFAIGETEDTQMPIAVAGRALVYTNEDRHSYEPGDAVCTGPNGTISKMTRDEIRDYPDCIVGYVSAIPDYEVWGEKNTVVDGRIWIKVA